MCLCCNTFGTGGYDMHNELPQGSILSPLLFNLMISDIPTDPSVPLAVYADDFVIWASGRDIPQISSKLQEYLNRLQTWFRRWGFRLSADKTVPIFFTKSTMNLSPPQVELDGNKVPFQNTHHFLGVTFDKKLTWKPHVENVVKRCKRKLNILRCLTGTKWGSSSKSLIKVYRAFIRSLLDYGCEAYDSATTTTKKALDSVQYQALRICAGGLPLTSLQSLQVEMGELPLDLRRQFVSSKYRQSIERSPNHPLPQNIGPCWQFDYLKGKDFLSKPFGYRTQSKIKKLDDRNCRTIPIPAMDF